VFKLTHNLRLRLVLRGELLFSGFHFAIGTVAAAGAATGAALEKIGCGEDQVWAFVVVIFWFKRGRGLGGWIPIHDSIFS
jgi:hypothetical protein